MPRKAHDLFDAIASFPALRAAALRAAAGKRAKPGVAAFLANLVKEVLRLERELKSRRYRPGRYKTIEIFDPKHRIVSAAPFRDRVVHHALCAVCEPLFERGFIHDSYANRTGKGTHRAVARYERFRDRFRHVLRCDINRYFPAIDHEFLKRDLRRRIACPRPLALADRIVDGSNPQEPVPLYYPGDDLFTPFERRRGLPIGNLTSQLFANLYLDGLDHFCKEDLRAKGYLRYVDDFALFHDDPERLEDWRCRIARFLEGRRLRRAIFRDGWFDPSRGPDRPPESAWCAAARGTTNRGTSAPPTATGTPPETGTTTTGSELPARSTAQAGGLTGPPGARSSVQGRS